VPAEFAYQLTFRAAGIVPDESRKLALLFLFSTCALGWLAWARHSPARARAMLANVRPLRSLHYVGMAAFGLTFGWVLFSRSGVEFAGGGDVLGGLAVCLAALLAFQSSIALNDLHDEEGDRIAASSRPLVTGALSRRDLGWQSAVFAATALLMALNVKYSTFLFLVLALALSVLYSVPPVRLKRFPVVSSLSLGVVSYLTVLVGFSAFAEERALALFPVSLAWVIVLSYGLGFAAKDLKDVDGDEATAVWTLPVLLGPSAGRFAVAALVFASYLAVALLLPYSMVKLPAILFGLGSATLVFVWNRRGLDRLLLAVSIVFTFAVAALVLTGMDVLIREPSEIERGKARELRGRLAESLDDWSRAAPEYAAAAEVFGDDPDVHLRAGAAHAEIAAYDAALSFLERAVDLDPANPVGLEYLTRVESRLGLVADVDWLLTETIRDGIRPGLFYEALGRHALDSGAPGMAVTAYGHALRLGRQDVPARLGLAEALASVGLAQEAEGQYRLAVERRPSSAEARDALGRHLIAVRRPGEALAQFREATRLDPDNAYYWNNLGTAHRMLGDVEAALRATEEAVRLAPRAPEPYYSRGLTLEVMGRKEEARRQFLLALEIDPSHAPARAALDRFP
jgi:4-hydroxybenzoate polyprenyltransferase/Flp pilus assembly protein TadD